MPVGHGLDEEKQSNEIKFAPILLSQIPIRNKDITSDAINTQTAFARYLVEERKAHYYLSVKANQPTLLEDIDVYFTHATRQRTMKIKSLWGMGELKFEEYGRPPNSMIMSPFHALPRLIK